LNESSRVRIEFAGPALGEIDRIGEIGITPE
jgi:hypothetical protein